MQTLHNFDPSDSMPEEFDDEGIDLPGELYDYLLGDETTAHYGLDPEPLLVIDDPNETLFDESLF